MSREDSHWEQVGQIRGNILIRAVASAVTLSLRHANSEQSSSFRRNASEAFRRGFRIYSAYTQARCAIAPCAVQLLIARHELHSEYGGSVISPHAPGNR